MRALKLNTQICKRILLSIFLLASVSTLNAMSSRPPVDEILDSVKRSLPDCPSPQYVYEKAATYFLTCDSLLKALANDDNVRSSNLAVSAKTLADINGNYPAITSFIRTNSKGMIIAQAEDGKAVPKSVHNFRNVSRQKWFEIISLSKKEYYGYIDSRSSGLCLFWNHPMIIRGAFTGAIAAKIDLKKAFKTIAEKEGISFRVKYGSETVFSNLKNDNNTIEKELAVFGISGLKIIYPEYNGRLFVKDEGTVLAQEKPEKKSPEKDEVDKAGKSKENKKSDDLKKEDKKSIEKTDVPGDKENDKSGFPAVLAIIFLILLIVMIISGLVYLQMRAKRKNREMMEAIDKGEM